MLPGRAMTCIATHSQSGMYIQERKHTVGLNTVKQDSLVNVCRCISRSIHTLFLCSSDYSLEAGSGASLLSTKLPSILERIRHFFASRCTATFGLQRTVP